MGFFLQQCFKSCHRQNFLVFLRNRWSLAFLVLFISRFSAAFSPHALQGGLLSQPAPKTFISTWNTYATSTGSSSATQIKLPLVSTGFYDFQVSWGDGSWTHIRSFDDPEVTHTYGSAGTYTLTIGGTLIGWQFNNSGDRLKIAQISQWGPLRLGNQPGAFYGATNLTITATDTLDLSGITTLSSLFRECWSLTTIPHIDSWDTSKVTDMSYLFGSAVNFNQSINTWDVSKVTDFSGMFQSAYTFNQPLNSWITSSATTMANMFNAAASFNQNISNWNTANVTDMSLMFKAATVFNQPLNSWNVGSVTNFREIFREARAFKAENEKVNRGGKK